MLRGSIHGDAVFLLNRGDNRKVDPVQGSAIRMLETVTKSIHLGLLSRGFTILKPALPILLDLRREDLWALVDPAVQPAPDQLVHHHIGRRKRRAPHSRKRGWKHRLGKSRLRKIWR